MCVSVYIYIHIYNIRASAAGGGRTNRRIPLHHTCKTYTMAMTTTTGNISSCYIYILNCIHAILLILYIIIYFSAVAFPQGPLTKRALAWKLFSKSTQKPPPNPVMCIPSPSRRCFHRGSIQSIAGSLNFYTTTTTTSTSIYTTAATCKVFFFQSFFFPPFF